FFYISVDHRDLHSFPTRRSSDLLPQDPDELAEILSYLPRKLDLTILYLDADHASLIKRFSETRRLHPLSHQAMSLDEAISREQRSEEHTSELQSRENLVCRLLLE